MAGLSQPEGRSAVPTNRRLKRLCLAGVGTAAIGIAVSAEILYVHSQIVALGGAYTSFCNVNASINCDRVLASAFSELFGIPVAWFALATYALLTVCLGLAWRKAGSDPSRPLALASVAIAGATAFSTYMACVSFFVLKTICLLCTSLYAVALALVLILLAIIRSRRDIPVEKNAVSLSLKRFVATVVLAGAGVLALAVIVWPRPESLGADLVSLDDVRQADPDFYGWYMKQPVVHQTFSARNALGPAHAAVTIVEFADMQCGHCRKSHAYLNALRSRRPDEVRIIYKHFPLDASCNEAIGVSVHRHACRAAEAAECAAQQGRFEEMLDALFDHQIELFDPTILRLAREIGLEMKKFQTCLDSDQARKVVQSDTRLGEKLQITSTPTLYFNGRKIVGGFDKDVDYDYAVLIESGLARDGG